MNKRSLIDELQESRHWNDFIKWYDDQKYSIDIEGEWVCDQPFQRFIGGFICLHFDLQMGVFLSYMKSKGFHVQIYFSSMCQYIKSHGSGASKTFDNPQKMILDFFNRQ